MWTFLVLRNSYLRSCTENDTGTRQTWILIEISTFLLKCLWKYNRIKDILKIKPYSKSKNLHIRNLLQSKVLLFTSHKSKRNVFLHLLDFSAFLVIQTRGKPCTQHKYLVFIMLISFRETNTGIFKRAD